MNPRTACRIRPLLVTAVLGAVMLPRAAVALPADSTVRPLTLAVLGHVRGDREPGLNPLFVEELEELRRLKPDAVLLTGDIIWGDYDHSPADSATIEQEWEQVDSALATLRLPVYRIPGNHDWHDQVTYRAWLRRYGALPQAVMIGRVRLLLVSTMPVPSADTARRVYTDRRLDSTQVRFLRSELADTGAYDHAFVLLHHLLWWAPDSAAWWRDVHPLLAPGRVAAVFSGDLGPLKFSHLERDGVHYYQSAIENQPGVLMLQRSPTARLISSQLDNFLLVTIAGREVRVEVNTVGAASSGRFTPEVHRAVYQTPMSWDVRKKQLQEAVGSLRLVALGSALALCAAFLLGGLWQRRRSRRNDA
jgi:hypothetical protein